MRLTYIKADQWVGIGSTFLKIDNSSFDSQVDAIQWYDTYGEIEFINRQQRNNEIFEDISYIQPLIDLWNAEKTKQDQLNAQKEQEQKKQQNISSIESDNKKHLNKINIDVPPKKLKKVYIYIHIPKTAGTFIKDLLAKYDEVSKIFDPFTGVSELPTPIKNAPTIKIVKEKLPAANSDDVGFFAMIRNPYDRVYSIWKWSRQNGIIGSIDFPAVPETFEEFVTLLDQGYYDSFYFMQSQLNFIKGEVIGTSNLTLFRFEDMEDIKDTFASCNVGWSETIINAVPGPNYKDAYTPEMVEIIKTKYRDEFDTLGYSTDL